MANYEDFFNLGAGPQGDQGIKGDGGETGFDGSPGQDGPQGNPGSDGPQGFGAVLQDENINMTSIPTNEGLGVTISNGTGPYTYLWTSDVTLGDPGDVIIVGTGASPTLNWNNGDDVGGTVSCEVTDTSNGDTAYCHTDFQGAITVIPPIPTVLGLPAGIFGIDLIGVHDSVSASVGTILKTNGELWYMQTVGANTPAPGNFWADPGDGFSSGDYEARMIPDGGFGGILNGAGSAPENTWLNLASQITWYMTEFVNGLRIFEGTLEIGLAGTSTAVVSAEVRMVADAISA